MLSRLICASLAFLAFTLLNASGQGTTTCEISGRLYLSDGTPAANVQVTIVKVAQNGAWLTTTPQTVSTDATGAIDFSVTRNAIAYLQANGVRGLNLLGGIPYQIPDAPTAAIESLWQLGVTSVNGQENDVVLAATDITNALGYAPIAPSSVIAAINASAESAKIADTQLSPNVARLNAPNTFTAALAAPSLVGGSAPSSSLNLAGTSNSSPAGANIILNGSGQGNVLIGGITDRKARLAIAGANTPGTTALSITKGANASSALDFFMDNTGKGVRFYTPGLTDPISYFNTRGAFFTRAWMVISGRGTGTGDQFNIPPPSADPSMLSIYADIFGPALQIRSQQKKFGAYMLSGMDYAGNYTFDVEEDGELRWGKTTRAAMDTNLYRASAGVLRTGGGVIVDKQLGVGTAATAPDAAVDISGGDSKGLLLRPRSVAGAPTSGTWSFGTIILDSKGVPYICVAAGTPGTWQKAITGDPAAATPGVTSFNNRAGVVSLTGQDVTSALGYTPANVAATVASFNGRSGGVALTGADVSTALGYAPVNPSLARAALSNSPETQTVQLPSGGGSVIALRPTDQRAGRFNFTVDAGYNYYAADPSTAKYDWTTTWGYNQTQDASASEKAGEPALAHRLETYYITPNGVEAMEAHLQYVNSRGQVYRPYAYFIDRNTDSIQFSQQVDAMSIADRATNTSYIKFQNHQVLLQGGTVVQATANNMPFLQQLNSARNKYLNVAYVDSSDRINVGDPLGVLRMTGATASITTGNVERLTVDSSGDVGVGSNSPAADAIMDINGGSSKGFRLRPRTQGGAPTSGTWSTGTMIVDNQGVLYICSSGGAPGQWTKVGAQ